MRPSAFVRVTAVVAAVGTLAVIAACSSSSTSPARGTVTVQLTDAPFTLDSVSAVNIWVVRVDGRMADADSATAAQGAGSDSASVGGWQTLAQPNASVNLLAYQNGSVFGIGSSNVSAGSYLGFRLVIDPSRSNITLKNGLVLTGSSTPGIMFPSGSTAGLKIALSSPIVVTANDTTTMVVDFDLANSFVLRGSTLTQNGLLFKPVITAKTK